MLSWVHESLSFIKQLYQDGCAKRVSRKAKHTTFRPGFVQSHHLDLAGAATRQFARCGIFCTPVIGLSPPSPASPFNTTMARTPKTAMIKAQMAEQTRLEEEARRQEEARRPDASTARTRSTELGRAAGSSSRDRDDVDVGEDKVEEGEKSCDADDAVSEEKDEGGSEDKDDGDSEDQHPPQVYLHTRCLHKSLRSPTVPADSPLMPGIEMMVEARAATPSIYNFIRSNSNHRVNMDDVRDLLTRMRNTGVQLSDNDAVAELILGFNQESPKNVSSLSRGASNGLYAQDQPIQLSATDNCGHGSIWSRSAYTVLAD
ncbi:hypothetical protein PC116_g25994 [Phytophthora cactorum]|nr:hypothetical protein PC116_g25994 [Phytophthora cactorum]